MRPNLAQGCALISRRRPRRPSSIGKRMPNPARSSTKPATERWRLSRKCPTASTTAASMPLRCTSCWPVRISSAPATWNRFEALWPNIVAALNWIDEFGDLDGDALIEYQRKTPQGLLHQGWKDSDDAICHADGSLARGPIALCEVQGYAFAAWQAAARLARALGHLKTHDHSRPRQMHCVGDSRTLFWCEEHWHIRTGT